MDWFMGKGRRKEKDAPLALQEDNKRYLDDDFICEKVLNTDWQRLISLPHNIDRNEWLATHTIAFFEHINMMYGSVSEFCTTTGCTAMSAPGNIQYQWVDEKGKKCKCAAPQYIEFVMTFIQTTIHDESVFPTKYGIVFPPTLESIVKKVHRLLFHVMAHLYAAHYTEIVLLHFHSHLNTLFEHFVTFGRQFSLVDEKEIEILDDLYKKLSAGASLQKDSMEAPPLYAVEDPSFAADTNRYDIDSDSSSRLYIGGTDVATPPVRPTSLPCGSDTTDHHKLHQSSNGSATCIDNNEGDNHCDDNKENLLCDSNQSATGLSSTSGTVASTSQSPPVMTT